MNCVILVTLQMQVRCSYLCIWNQHCTVQRWMVTFMLMLEILNFPLLKMILYVKWKYTLNSDAVSSEFSAKPRSGCPANRCLPFLKLTRLSDGKKKQFPAKAQFIFWGNLLIPFFVTEKKMFNFKFNLYRHPKTEINLCTETVLLLQNWRCREKRVYF